MKSSPYFAQADLMIQVLPHVAAEECFALKGGTAINLFVHNMPRLSVDIDLTYVPIERRESSLTNIDAALGRIAASIEATVPGVRAIRRLAGTPATTVKLTVGTQNAQVKIEPNTIIRGTVFGVEQRELVAPAQDLFEASVDVQSLSLPDLYGGKLCAALDRQHPRDLFDVKLLLESTGLTAAVRQAFVVYLASHNRPMAELLDPNLHDMTQSYRLELEGMTREAVTLDELIETRLVMIRSIRDALTDNERKFLLSLKEGAPDWGLMPLSGISDLPALRWKLQNIRKMNDKSRMLAVERLEKVLTQ